MKAHSHGAVLGDGLFPLFESVVMALRACVLFYSYPRSVICVGPYLFLGIGIHEKRPVLIVSKLSRGQGLTRGSL